MTSNIINIKNLNKTYGTTAVLKSINLEITRGSISGFIGKSGAGKTTLIRCMNLLENPDSGEIFINGEDITKSSEINLKNHRKKIGMIFQSFNLISCRTVYENIALPLELSNLPKKHIAERVKSIAKLVEIDEHLDKYPSALSGGQKQKVAIARAVINEAEILLCDEFTSALDPETTMSMLRLLRDLNAKLGVTIVLITHDMSVIREICDYVFVIYEGEIVESGNIEKVYYNAEHKITKSLINSSFKSEIPNKFLSRIIPAPQENDEVMVRLTFSSSSASTPVISELIMKFQIYVNIISANFDHFRDAGLGNLLVIFAYDQTNYVDIIKFLEARRVHIEVLGYLQGGKK